MIYILIIVIFGAPGQPDAIESIHAFETIAECTQAAADLDTDPMEAFPICITGDA